MSCKFDFKVGVLAALQTQSGGIQIVQDLDAAPLQAAEIAEAKAKAQAIQQVVGTPELTVKDVQTAGDMHRDWNKIKIDKKALDANNPLKELEQQQEQLQNQGAVGNIGNNGPGLDNTQKGTVYGYTMDTVDQDAKLQSNNKKTNINEQQFDLQKIHHLGINFCSGSIQAPGSTPSSGLFGFQHIVDQYKVTGETNLESVQSEKTTPELIHNQNLLDVSPNGHVDYWINIDVDQNAKPELIFDLSPDIELDKIDNVIAKNETQVVPPSIAQSDGLNNAQATSIHGKVGDMFFNRTRKEGYAKSQATEWTEKHWVPSLFDVVTASISKGVMEPLRAKILKKAPGGEVKFDDNGFILESDKSKLWHSKTLEFKGSEVIRNINLREFSQLWRSRGRNEIQLEDEAWEDLTVTGTEDQSSQEQQQGSQQTQQPQDKDQQQQQGGPQAQPNSGQQRRRKLLGTESDLDSDPKAKASVLALESNNYNYKSSNYPQFYGIDSNPQQIQQSQQQHSPAAQQTQQNLRKLRIIGAKLPSQYKMNQNLAFRAKPGISNEARPLNADGSINYNIEKSDSSGSHDQELNIALTKLHCFQVTVFYAQFCPDFLIQQHFFAKIASTWMREAKDYNFCIDMFGSPDMLSLNEKKVDAQFKQQQSNRSKIEKEQEEAAKGMSRVQKPTESQMKYQQTKEFIIESNLINTMKTLKIPGGEIEPSTSNTTTIAPTSANSNTNSNTEQQLPIKAIVKNTKFRRPPNVPRFIINNYLFFAYNKKWNPFYAFNAESEAEYQAGKVKKSVNYAENGGWKQYFGEFGRGGKGPDSNLNHGPVDQDQIKFELKIIRMFSRSGIDDKDREHYDPNLVEPPVRFLDHHEELNPLNLFGLLDGGQVKHSGKDSIGSDLKNPKLQLQSNMEIVQQIDQVIKNDQRSYYQSVVVDQDTTQGGPGKGNINTNQNSLSLSAPNTNIDSSCLTEPLWDLLRKKVTSELNLPKDVGLDPNLIMEQSKYDEYKKQGKLSNQWLHHREAWVKTLMGLSIMIVPISPVIGEQKLSQVNRGGPSSSTGTGVVGLSSLPQIDQQSKQYQLEDFAKIKEYYGTKQIESVYEGRGATSPDGVVPITNNQIPTRTQDFMAHLGKPIPHPKDKYFNVSQAMPPDQLNLQQQLQSINLKREQEKKNGITQHVNQDDKMRIFTVLFYCVCYLVCCLGVCVCCMQNNQQKDQQQNSESDADKEQNGQYGNIAAESDEDDGIDDMLAQGAQQGGRGGLGGGCQQGTSTVDRQSTQNMDEFLSSEGKGEKTKSQTLSRGSQGSSQYHKRDSSSVIGKQSENNQILTSTESKSYDGVSLPSSSNYQQRAPSVQAALSAISRGSGTVHSQQSGIAPPERPSNLQASTHEALDVLDALNSMDTRGSNRESSQRQQSTQIQQQGSIRESSSVLRQDSSVRQSSQQQSSIRQSSVRQSDSIRQSSQRSQQSQQQYRQSSQALTSIQPRPSNLADSTNNALDTLDALNVLDKLGSDMMGLHSNSSGSGPGNSGSGSGQHSGSGSRSGSGAEEEDHRQHDSSNLTYPMEEGEHQKIPAFSPLSSGEGSYSEEEDKRPLIFGNLLNSNNVGGVN